ncbi:PREDICTED: kunitz-type elastase inhibitor BrEI-like [Ipomoea nil]|uniref:kunitz-type elastase inhibitor BrEI-like n=1 Tax=Ipomoea nil TaxID=35883 RepID=UPI000900C5EE|nr:PREDICTED: kunitz-type elastase inhibitor BrEI-like [Ipomoea nil]
MKTAIILLVLCAISFLPLAISDSGLPPLIRLPTKPHLTAFHSPILDTAGNPVIAGAKYYAVPALIGVEGGISVANLNTTGNPSACPTDVVINETLAGNQPPAVGRPLSFYPQKLKGEATDDDVVILAQFPLNVAFDSPDPSDPCAKENVWKLQATIVTGGVIGNEDDISNWFRIQKNFNGRGYIFNWWPILCLNCKIGYSVIGRVGDGSQLGIDSNAESLYGFELVKAD